MKRIHYADEHFVTGDDIADGVMAYARQLALVGRSDSVELPALTAEGEVAKFQVLLGPASQMVVSDDATTTSVIDDPDLVADLRARIDAIQRLTGVDGPESAPAQRPSTAFPDLDLDRYADPQPE